MKALVVILLAYAIGSVPFGYLIVRAMAGADIRQSGSGGTGATNVSRRAGKFAGLLTLILDAAKGAVAVLIARSFLAPEGVPTWPFGIAAIAVVVGHIFPVWLGFRGGKGVATGVGVFLIIAPFAVALAGLVFFVVVFLTRYVSLGSILAASAIPLFVWIQVRLGQLPDPDNIIFCVSIVLAVLIVFAHRANISRLISGTENKWQ